MTALKVCAIVRRSHEILSNDALCKQTTNQPNSLLVTWINLGCAVLPRNKINDFFAEYYTTILFI